MEKALKENKEKLPADEVTKIEAALEKAKQDLKTHENNPEELQKATDELLQASYKITEILLKQKEGQPEAGRGRRK